MTVARVKKRNPASFMKGVLANPELDQMESGTSVGLRALGWGTVFALTGVGTLSFVTCKLIGVSSVEEFKVKFQSVAPEIRRNDAAEVEATMSELQSGIFDEKDGG
ncbi:transmembrane protein 242-like [Apostichopus japonicus]|uniref:transmembrane protein 242-like n=1 Tax=Stichopus japonicus TaxID=307972 RepID=UPI003AB81983